MTNVQDLSRENIEPGTVVEPGVFNAWIDPQGKMHFVPFYGHYDAAHRMQGVDSDVLEKRGWVHFSLAEPGYVLLGDRFNPTDAQMDTFFNLLSVAREIDPNVFNARFRHFKQAVASFFIANQIDVGDDFD